MPQKVKTIDDAIEMHGFPESMKNDQSLLATNMYIINELNGSSVNHIEDGRLYVGLTTRRGDATFFVKENGSYRAIEATITPEARREKIQGISRPYVGRSEKMPTFIPYGLYSISRQKLPSQMQI